MVKVPNIAPHQNTGSLFSCINCGNKNKNLYKMSVDKSVIYFDKAKLIETKNERSFSSAEDVAICKAFLSVLEDFRVGNLQSETNLCIGIFEKFVASTKNESRSQESVRSRWEKIMTRCFKFHAYLLQIIYDQCQKGLTMSDMVYQAKLLYVESERQQFFMEHCWDILEHRLFKWQDIHDNKNTNTTTKTIASSTQFMGVSQIPDFPFPSQEFDRKTCRGCGHSAFGEGSGGREAEKERPQGKDKAVELETSQIDDLTEQLNKQTRRDEIKKAQLEEKRLRLTKKMQEIEERQVEAKLLEIDDAIMSMDTSEMDHQTKLYWEMRRDEIIARAFNRLVNNLG